MRWVLLAAALATAVLAAACGASHKPTDTDETSWDCRDRSASYLATHTMAAPQVGVQIDCKEHGPRLLTWRTDASGKRTEKSRVLTPAQFDKIWNQLDNTGWQNMQDCPGSGNADDPVYQFMVSDDQNHASFSCQAREMPYPYNDISDPLQLAASAGGAP
jgi:hypothetical protein